MTSQHIFYDTHMQHGSQEKQVGRLNEKSEEEEVLAKTTKGRAYARHSKGVSIMLCFAYQRP